MLRQFQICSNNVKHLLDILRLNILRKNVIYTYFEDFEVYPNFKNFCRNKIILFKDIEVYPTFQHFCLNMIIQSFRRHWGVSYFSTFLFKYDNTFRRH